MKKSTLVMILSLVLAVALGVGGTLAYLTDTDADVNVMVVGNVDIEQHEQDRDGNDFEQFQQMLPLVGSVADKDDNGYPAPNNYIDKIVTVENTGKTDAYVRTFIAIPLYTYADQESGNASANVIHWNGYSQGDTAPQYPAAVQIPGTDLTAENNWFWGPEGGEAWPGNYGDWNTFKTTIDGQEYMVYVVTNTEKVAAGEITAPNMIGVYLDSKVDYDHATGKYTYDGKVIEGFDGTVEVLVATQAVQYDASWTAWEALDTAFYTPDAEHHPWLGVAPNDAPTSLQSASNAEELLAAIEDGGVIHMADDIDLGTEAIVIPADANVTLKMNGKTLSGTSDKAESTAMITNKGTLVIEGNGTIDYCSTGAAGDSAYGFYTIDNSGNLTIDGTTVKNSTEDVWVDGSMNKTVFAIDHKGGLLTIDSGVIESTGRSVRIAGYSGKDADAVLNGGTFIGQVWLQGLNNRNASLVVNGGEYGPVGADGSSIFVGNALGNNTAEINAGLFNTKVGANVPNGFLKGGVFATQEAYDNTNVNVFAAENTVTVK